MKALKPLSIISLETKKILVTGGTGSIGSEIVRRLLKFELGAIRIFSNDEDGLFNLQQELRDYKELRFLLGDVRDKDRLRMSCEDVDVVFHTAALKHVPTCEYNPFEAVRTNVIGTQNLLEVALLENVEKFYGIKTPLIYVGVDTEVFRPMKRKKKKTVRN